MTEAGRRAERRAASAAATACRSSVNLPYQVIETA